MPHWPLLLLSSRFLRSCMRRLCVHTRFSDSGGDLQDPRHTGFSPHSSKHLGEEAFLCPVKWSRGREAYGHSCFAGGCPLLAPATHRYLTISKLRLRKKRKKRRKCF